MAKFLLFCLGVYFMLEGSEAKEPGNHLAFALGLFCFLGCAIYGLGDRLAKIEARLPPPPPPGPTFWQNLKADLWTPHKPALRKHSEAIIAVGLSLLALFTFYATKS